LLMTKMSSNKETGRYLRSRAEKDPKFRSFITKLGGTNEAKTEETIGKLAKEIAKSPDPIAAVNRKMAEEEKAQPAPTMQAALGKILAGTSPKQPIPSWSELVRRVSKETGEEPGSLDNAHFYREVLAIPRIVEEPVQRESRTVYRYYLSES
jgi:hypothetical protein